MWALAGLVSKLDFEDDLARLVTERRHKYAVEIIAHGHN